MRHTLDRAARDTAPRPSRPPTIPTADIGQIEAPRETGTLAAALERAPGDRCRATLVDSDRSPGTAGRARLGFVGASRQAGDEGG